ncbi:hypothetical protein ACVW0J_008897 [Bradyrhizobium sp. i1.7.7]
MAAARRDHEIAAVFAQHRGRRRLRGDHAQVQAPDLSRDMIEEPRQQQIALEIIGGDRQRKLRARRLEGDAAGKAAHLVDQRPRFRSQGLGMGGGDDAAAGFGKQRIARDPPQLVQPVTDRRLRQTKPRRCRRDRAFLQHGKEQFEGVAVERQMIDFLHVIHYNRSIYLENRSSHDLPISRAPGPGRHRERQRR